jgi:hypothetical protein
MSDVLERMRAVVGCGGDTYSSYEVVGLLSQGANEIERLRIRIEALKAILETHRCNADGRTSVAECVESGQCGCTCGLLLKAETP